MDKKLLEILVCPVTKGPLVYDKKNKELISKSARVMLEDDARELTLDEIEQLKK